MMPFVDVFTARSTSRRTRRAAEVTAATAVAGETAGPAAAEAATAVVTAATAVGLETAAVTGVAATTATVIAGTTATAIGTGAGGTPVTAPLAANTGVTVTRTGTWGGVGIVEGAEGTAGTLDGEFLEDFVRCRKLISPGKRAINMGILYSGLIMSFGGKTAASHMPGI